MSFWSKVCKAGGDVADTVSATAVGVKGVVTNVCAIGVVKTETALYEALGEQAIKMNKVDTKVFAKVGVHLTPISGAEFLKNHKVTQVASTKEEEKNDKK